MEARFKENRPQGTPLHPLKLYRMQTAAGRIDVPLHWQDTVELLWVQRGTAASAGGGPAIFRAARGCVLHQSPAASRHADRRTGEPLPGVCLSPLSWLRFALTDEAEQRYLHPLSADAARVENALPAGICPSAAALLADVAALYERESPGGWLGIKADMLRLYFALYAGNLVNRNAAGQRQDTRMAVSRYIQDHCAEPLSLETLGRQFHMSPKYFSSWFQKHFFRTFTDYLTAVRLEQAKTLLQDTEADIELIAQRSGFSAGSLFHPHLPPCHRQDARALPAHAPRPAAVTPHTPEQERTGIRANFPCTGCLFFAPPAYRCTRKRGRQASTGRPRRTTSATRPRRKGACIVWS